jgi:NitT/TauT family transport system substrate-binding protein
MSPYISGADFKIVMIEDYSAGSDGLVVQPDIKSVEDLKGKTVATEIGTVDHMFLNKCLENAGMTEADINLTNMSIGDAGNAFIAGQVDAAVVWDPSLSLAVDAGGTVLSSTKDYPGLIPAVMAVNGDVLGSRRDDVKKVMQAWFNSLDGYDSNHEEFVKAVAEGAEISVEDFEMLMEGVDLISLEDNTPAFETSDDYVSLVTCGKEHCEFLKSVDMISEVPESLDDLIDGSLISELVAESE